MQFNGSCPPLVVPFVDPILIAAASFKNRASVRRGKAYALQVTLAMPALVGGRRLAASKEKEEEEEEQQQQRELRGFKKPLNTTDYALLVTVPAGGAADVMYRRTVVRPGLKPAALKKPQVQGNGDLLWTRVPMPRYMDKAYTRTFKVRKRRQAGVGARSCWVLLGGSGSVGGLVSDWGSIDVVGCNPVTNPLHSKSLKQRCCSR